MKQRYIISSFITFPLSLNKRCITSWSVPNIFVLFGTTGSSVTWEVLVMPFFIQYKEFEVSRSSLEISVRLHCSTYSHNSEMIFEEDLKSDMSYRMEFEVFDSIIFFRWLTEFSFGRLWLHCNTSPFLVQELHMTYCLQDRHWNYAGSWTDAEPKPIQEWNTDHTGLRTDHILTTVLELILKPYWP